MEIHSNRRDRAGYSQRNERGVYTPGGPADNPRQARHNPFRVTQITVAQGYRKQ